MRFLSILTQIKESFIFAFQALLLNPLRTVLSVLGITIGIFCIIAVLAVVGSLEKNLKESIDSLGNDVVYVQKWPWFEANYPWWKYLNRPQPTIEELRAIERRSIYTDGSAMMVQLQNKLIKYENNSVSNVGMLGVTHNWDKTRSFDLEDGRYFSERESSSGYNVAILGSDIAEALFPNTSAIGRDLRVRGFSVKIVGVFKREGSSLIGNTIDNVIVLPYNFIGSMVNVRQANPTIIVKCATGIPLVALEDELKGIMRAQRRLKPKEDDSFALNKTTILSSGISQTFVIINIAGWIIGGFSILVGGFGIANIMFVSVRERTNQIGIQKALGAKYGFILSQFLFESIALCIIGGAVGMLLVFLGTLATSASGFAITLSASNVITGILVSVIIGIISGIVPAHSAAKLDPVEAMRF